MTDGPDARVPDCVTDEAIRAIESSGPCDVVVPAEVKRDLGIPVASIKALLLDAIWTQNMWLRPFDTSIRSWAATRHVDRAWTMRALGELVDDGVVTKRGRPGHPSDLWVDAPAVYYRVRAWEESGRARG